MKIEKVNLKDGGCGVCDRAKYAYTDNDVKVTYPYNFVYKIEIDRTIHILCEDCLKELDSKINDALK